MCTASYTDGESPASRVASNTWDTASFIRMRHAIHFRDLYQQKLAFVRGFHLGLEARKAGSSSYIAIACRYLGSQERLTSYEALNFGFLRSTVDAGQYFDEGADGR